MELEKVFYLINVANAVNISQPSVFIGVGLHALIYISQQSVWTRPIYLPNLWNQILKVRKWYSDLL